MTTVISAEKIDDNSFYVDVLYYTGTSYSKSVYPTLARAFQKYALELMNGGSYKSRSIDIEINNKLLSSIFSALITVVIYLLLLN